MSDSFGSDSSYSNLGSELASASVPSEAPNSSGADSEDEVLVEAPSALFGDTDSDTDPLSLELYRQPRQSLKGLLISTAINCLLPFINGMMLGFGEIFAHEIGFRWGWSAARVC